MSISAGHFVLVTLLLVHTDIVRSEVCSSLPNIEGGQYSCTDGFADRSVCTYTCQIHYTLIGEGALNCSLGSWDVAVPICTPNNGAIRILTVSPNKGTLEIYYGGWGIISHDGFTDMSATVACRQLQLGNVGLAYKGAYFGPSATGMSLLNDVNCFGNEIDIKSCPHSGFALLEAIPGHEVGIECLDQYEYRLADGSTPNSGRVEIRADNQWVGICDDQFNMAAANVACNYLGYSGALDYHTSSEFISGPTTAHYFNLSCSGEEANLAQCKHEVGDGGACPFGNIGAGATCRGGGVRLVGPTSDEGVVEIFHGGRWGLIDTYAITEDTAKVVCNILGFGFIGYQVNYYEVPLPLPVLLYYVDCLGNETDIVQCPHSGWIDSSSTYDYGSGVVCRPFNITDIRLVGGAYPFEGRVEIQVAGIWGTVCDDIWDLEDAHVICRMLRYSHAEDSYRQAYFGEGTGYILADDVQCAGHETHLDQCSFTKGQAGHNCIHSEDASVKCWVNKRCFHQWLQPETTKFPMIKSLDTQSNFTQIESMYTFNDMGCIRKCNAHARENCGQLTECKMAKFTSSTGICTLYKWERVNSTIPCSVTSLCYLTVY